MTLRPLLTVAAALLLAGSATAQPTPETPGPAGAEAAVVAVIAAQRARDWPALVALLDPDLVTWTADYTRETARQLHAVLADSAEAVRSGRIERELDGDLRVFAMARRLDAVVPPGETAGDADLLVRVLRASQARQPAFFAAFPNPPTFQALGTVTEGDSLAHIVGRTEWPSDVGERIARIETVSMRWNGTRWTLSGDQYSVGDVLTDLTLTVGNWGEVIAGIAEDPADLSTGEVEDGPVDTWDGVVDPDDE